MADWLPVGSLSIIGLAAEVVALGAEETKWAALVGESPSWRTNVVREVRRRALAVA